MKLSCPLTCFIWTAIGVLTLSCASGSQPEKELYIPAEVYLVPKNNDYDNNESDYSFRRMAESDNIAIFWHKDYGDDPMKVSDERKRFDVQFALKECERFYNYYVNDLKVVQKGSSLTDKYKMLVYVFSGPEETAFGGGSDEKIGILWTNATRISKPPYGALAHEMGHCFQYLSGIDSGTGPAGAIIEMSAQYMLWQVYPEWMTFENYHLKDFLKQTHYAFLHPVNMYHSPYVLEYWADLHGKDFFGNLCRATIQGEDVVTTYKRMNNLTQEQFNDEMFGGACRFITWDLKRVEKVARPYANQHVTLLTDAGDGWQRVDSLNCPQNYGYNGIKLEVPPAVTAVTLQFKGIAGAPGYTAVNTDKAGWRYGFVAYLSNGRRIYSSTGREPEGSLTFEVPKNTEYLWLVVSGAPKEHWPIVMRWGPDAEQSSEEQWPYMFKIN
ncbi:MAG: DUF6055 domain-containing protein [Bacteroidales bacterium]|jgi:hypothetical protein